MPQAFLKLMSWSALGLGLLVRGTGASALLRCVTMLGVALLVCALMLVLDIWRVLEQHEVEGALLCLGVLLPAGLPLAWKASLMASKLQLKKV
ncbi:hypothetical protein F3J44_13305 [Pantoea sp. Tr-811]|uniref:hypothetical protein n=1 Tax=Pantoea sp. Tr-811 TaxID=2608361 RepID=UPI001421FEF5|nr:hypothetical protein [Pantoea sp. Tr-811]NIF27346.1 hypothetical protein [Pantoea sp. Tr-811]